MKQVLATFAAVASIVVGLQSTIALAASCAPFTPIPTSPAIKNCNITGVGNASTTVISLNGATKTSWEYKLNFFAGNFADSFLVKSNGNLATRVNGSTCSPAVDNSKDGTFGGPTVCSPTPTFGTANAPSGVRVSIN